MPDGRSLPLPDNTDVVTHVVNVGGERLPLSAHVLSISIDKEVDRISTATIVLGDGDASSGQFELSSQELFVPGAEIEFLLGYQSTHDTVFKGIVVSQSLRLKLEGTSTLSVECRHAAVKMTLQRRCKYFAEMTDSDVAAELVSDYKLDTDFATTDITHEELVQYDCTDWDFLLSRLEANGQICLVDDDGLRGVAPDIEQNPEITLTYGATMLEFDAVIDARSQATEVLGVSWDPATQEIVEGDGADPGVPDVGNLSSSALADSLGQGRRLQHSGRLSTEEVQAWADATMLRNRLGKIRGRASFQGLPGVKPGQFIELQGVGDRFNGPVFVSGVKHRLADGAWTTDVQLGLCSMPFLESMAVNKPPASSLIPSIPGIQIGLVTKLSDDPAGENRIQVRLPVIDPESEGIWARLNTLDAGEERGTFFLPEIDDEVLVGFINDDPREAVVLGMLHSSAKPAPFEATDENHEKGYVSRDGLVILFHDEEKSISISTPEGNQILLSEDETAVHIKDQNGNEILMNGDGITVTAEGDFNLTASGDVSISGSNVTLDAQSAFGATGSSSSEITSDGSTTVKGSTVMIN